MKQKSIFVVGGGLTGMMSSYLIARKHPDRHVVLLEKQQELGGTYKSFKPAHDAVFDVGIHVLYSTGEAEIDDAFFDVLPEEEWHVLRGNRKDIAGLFFQGRLQTYSHYMDLRSLHSEALTGYVADFYSSLDQPKAVDLQSAMTFLHAQFGAKISTDFHKPLLESLWGVNAEALDLFAVKINALERVILHNKETMSSLMQAPILASRIAYPDQLGLPPIRKNEQFALYPKKFGMETFVRGFSAKLADLGVEVLTDVQVDGLSRGNDAIGELRYRKNGEKIVVVDPEAVVWSMGLPPLAAALGCKLDDLEFDRGPHVVFVNLVFDQPLAMEETYYFYCYDQGFGTFRVSNYVNYCADAGSNGTYPVCVEFWPSRLGLNAPDMSDAQLVEVALDELKRFGVLSDTSSLLFSDVRNTGFRFPIPTTNNMRAFETLRERLDVSGLKNLATVGVLAEKDIFLSHEVLSHVNRVIGEML